MAVGNSISVVRGYYYREAYCLQFRQLAEKGSGTLL